MWRRRTNLHKFESHCEPEGDEPEELEPGVMDGLALRVLDEHRLKGLNEDATLFKVKKVISIFAFAGSFH